MDKTGVYIGLDDLVWLAFLDDPGSWRRDARRQQFDASVIIWDYVFIAVEVVEALVDAQEGPLMLSCLGHFAEQAELVTGVDFIEHCWVLLERNARFDFGNGRQLLHPFVGEVVAEIESGIPLE